jgi:hypothetical protein
MVNLKLQVIINVSEGHIAFIFRVEVQYYKPEAQHLNLHRSENLKSNEIASLNNLRRTKHVSLFHKHVFHMSDILNTSFTVLQPFQQTHLRAMHGHTRHPLFLPSATLQKEIKREKEEKCGYEHVVRAFTYPSM